MKYQIGSDPELFLVDPKTGKIVSAIGIIPGVKHNAYIPQNLPKGYGLQVDNILAEFNIPPITLKEELINNINVMKHYIKEYLKQHNFNLDIHCAASANVPDDQLLHPDALIFGCDPDFNTYSRRQNQSPTCENKNLRSAGCHFHIGYKNPNIEMNFKIIQYLDTYLGIPSILKDTDTSRRALYGKAGALRMQPWGVEYRTLSGFFISNDELLEFCYIQIQKALKALESNTILPEFQIVEHIINNNDTTLAKTIINQFNIL